MSLLDGIGRLFSHGDHCELHPVFEASCEACQLVRLQRQVYTEPAPIFYDSADAPTSTDSGSDFGGFDGGDSGGGGASGDF